MPTPTRISVPVKQSTSVKSGVDSTTLKTTTPIRRPKARVVHRRRPRGRLGDTESDDELVREPQSDSDSGSATSTLDSESPSDSEPDHEEPKPEARISSPTRQQLVATGPSSLPPHHPTGTSVFPHSHDWSDMVAEENASGTAALPVIDFADLSSHVPDAPSPTHADPTPQPPAPEQPETSRRQNVVATASSSGTTRKPGQSARQAYLSRLDSDPAYVPTLGQFWSHDDRLLEKDLRSLSGWWRGRWQGRGRGTRVRGGFSGGWGMRGMRGRGGFSGGNGSFRSEDVPQDGATPVDRAWTHDGFEEMKQAEETQRQQFQFRGRGGVRRGRGASRGHAPPIRGGFLSANRSSSPNGIQNRPRSNSQNKPHSGSQANPQADAQRSPVSDTLKFGNGTRPWFAMKPERVWTKQFDAYLYFEAQLKPLHNQGLGQGVRIKLPKGVSPNTERVDAEAVIIRLPQRVMTTPKSERSTFKDSPADKTIVVKLPSSKGAGKEREILGPEDVITVPPPPIEDSLATFSFIPTPHNGVHLAQETPEVKLSQSLEHVPEVKNSMSQISRIVAPPLGQPPDDPTPQEIPFTASPVVNSVASASSSQPRARFGLKGPENKEPVPSNQPQPPVLPALQAVAPPFQPSPPYGSPYAYATPGPSGLPPGIAVSEAGVAYEIATGRTVYLHTPPPPSMQAPMYNPRPIPMHHPHHGSVHFLPHHAHGQASSMSMSVSPPAFLASPPIFSLPRQSSRIEIRAPGEEKKERPIEEELNSHGRESGSRLMANVNAESFTPSSLGLPQAMGYYTAEAQQQTFDDVQRHQQSLYRPTSYYYPVSADGSTPYGYGQHYANVDVGQPQQYDTYGQESYPQQHAVYY